MRRFLLACVIPALALTNAFAKEKDLTAPILTCGVIGQLVQDAAVSLGPLRQVQELLPASAAENPYKQPSLDRSGSRPLTKNYSPKQQQPLKNRVFEPQAYHFTGEQMWGKAEATLITASRGFDVKVKCTLPVTMWALIADEAQIASSSVPNLTTFAFKGNELYTPPYTLVLNVVYMGIPNQIRIEIK